MRLLKIWEFQIGTKIPYSEWPEIVHRYLREQGLTCGKFLYYFKDLCYPPELGKAVKNGVGCERLFKDLPTIGAPREYRASRGSGPDNLFLSNIDIGGGCTEEQILPLMKKIHRSYGLVESDLYYLDVDFFSDVIPAERDMRRVEEICRRAGGPFDPLCILENQPCGSGFRLYRYSTGGNWLSLSIDVLRNGEVVDPSAYFEAFQALLPGVRHSEYLKLLATDGEQEEFDRCNAAAAPTVERCRSWLEERLPRESSQNHFVSQYKLAPTLKKLAKRYGLAYAYFGGGVYALEKETSRGHSLCLLADSGPSRFDASFYLSFEGLGFRHRLCNAQFTPTNQEEFDTCAEQVLSVLADFEKEMLPALDACWPYTPDWYIPKI